jgi:transposase
MQETAKVSRPKKRQRRSRSDWTAEIKRWRESGQSAVEYAEVRGIHAGTLAGWASKVRESSGARARGDARSMFVPVRVAPATPTSEIRPERGEVEVVLRNGRRVRVSGDFDSGSLARLLMVAEGDA